MTGKRTFVVHAKRRQMIRIVYRASVGVHRVRADRPLVPNVRGYRHVFGVVLSAHFLRRGHLAERGHLPPTAWLRVSPPRNVINN